MESITIKDIAKLCNCGVSTVSRALNNHPDINPETKQRIMDVVQEYNFVPNNSARNLKLTESRTIEVLVKGMTNPFFSSMIKIMEEEIQRFRYSMEICHVDEETDEVEVAKEHIKEKRLKGIVFLGGSFGHSKEKLDGITVPFVISTIALTGEYDGTHSSVSVDDIKESYKIVDYLCKMGHKNIAILTASAEDVSIGKLRTEGYRKALLDNKCDIKEELIGRPVNPEDIYTMSNGYLSMKKLLDKGVDFTAVFAISDTMAVGAYRALSEAGKRIPEDVSIVGFDGIEIGAYCTPSLTTVRQPIEDMAKETIKILFDVIKNNASHERKIFDAELLTRESVADLRNK